MKHPETFYIAHRVYDLRGGQTWGSLTDGPADRDEMLTRVMDSFRDKAPTLGNLRVWWFQDDVPPRDVTEDFITAWEVENAPSEDEMEEQRRCDDADDYAHLMRENAA